MQRRMLMKAMMAFCVSPALAHAAGERRNGPTIEVYKSETCGCCTQWVAHLQENGFKVKAHNVPNTAAYRARLGIPAALGSCHTAAVSGYALEGHVPAAEIRRLLAEKPRAVGLAVPGMPLGSPGMERPGHAVDAYDVLLLRTDGRQEVYRRYEAR